MILREIYLVVTTAYCRGTNDKEPLVVSVYKGDQEFKY